MEIKWLKKQMLEATKEMIELKERAIKQQATLEIRNILNQFNTLREQTIRIKEENSSLIDRLTGYESHIANLTNYVNSLRQNFADEEDVIRELDIDAIECEPQTQMKPYQTKTVIKKSPKRSKSPKSPKSPKSNRSPSNMGKTEQKPKDRLELSSKGLLRPLSLMYENKRANETS